MNDELNSPNILLYSLTLPLLWLSLGSLMDYFLPGKRLGLLGLVLIVYATITPICWHFTRKFVRHFSTKEKLKLIVYLTVWAVIFEFWTLAYDLSINSTPKMEGPTLYYLLGFTVVLDALFMSLGVHFIGKRMSNFFLANGAHSNA